MHYPMKTLISTPKHTTKTQYLGVMDKEASEKIAFHLS
jgi:hypothetical protein